MKKVNKYPIIIYRSYGSIGGSEGIVGMGVNRVVWGFDKWVIRRMLDPIIFSFL